MNTVITNDTFVLDTCKAVFPQPTLKLIGKAYAEHNCVDLVCVEFDEPYDPRKEFFSVIITYSEDGNSTWTAHELLERYTSYAD